MLVGTNKTRRAYNQRMRDLKGFSEPLPVAGDRLVCLRNDRTKGLINGGLWRVETLGGVKKDFVKMTLRSEDEGARSTVKVSVLKAFFEGTEGELSFPLRRESDEFDYGYALTVHKAQGSQWDDVMLFDESFAFREHRARWLYTGLTRAARQADGGQMKGGRRMDIGVAVLLDLTLRRRRSCHAYFPSDEGSARLRPGHARFLS